MPRISELALALSRDGLRDSACSDAYRTLFGRLDGLMAQHTQKVADASKGILQVEGETLVARVIGGEIRDRDVFIETADALSVEADFRAAARVLTTDIARQYADQLAEPDEDDDGLFDAHVKVAALAQVEGVLEELDREADQLCARWFDLNRVDIKGLSDEHQTVYDQIKGLSPEPQTTELKRPRVRTEETKDEKGQKLEMRIGHLMNDEHRRVAVTRLTP